MKRVILVRPAGPRNVGTALRVVDNFGPCELWVVAPARPALLIHPEFEQMSHGVENIDEKLFVADTLKEALAACAWSVGFTARVRDNVLRANWNELRPELLGKADHPEERLALVFGSEEFGLDASEAALCQELAHIRTSPDHTSLNLAMCVGIVLQGLFTGEAVHRPEPGGHPLNGDEREFLKENLKHALSTKVARSPESARVIAASVERVFTRSPLNTSDARAWHMMARALGSKLTPKDLGLNPNPTRRTKHEQ